jgi:uncharacterized 2Fe-2S/4Fe-4S cluster protein (DUF4445 family)
MKLRIQPFRMVLNAPKGVNLLSALAPAGIHLRSDCGGVGRCGKCKVLCHGGLTAPNQSEMKIISSKELEKGVRLACQAKVRKPTEVFVPAASIENQIQILVEGTPRALKLNPSVEKKSIQISFQRFEKDLNWEAIRCKKGPPNRSELSPTLHFLQRLSGNGGLKENRLSCILMNQRCVDIERADTDRRVYGMALDIGTTTIVGYLLDLTSGNQVSLSAMMNPQTEYGGDVVSRILYATTSPNGLKRLQDALIVAVSEIVQEASKRARVSTAQIYEICAVGNTTMHHLLLGLRPSNLTHFPYTPVIRRPFAFPAKEIGISIHPEGQFYLPPLVAGFMGSDTVGVTLSTFLHKSKVIKLAIDIGTNGEIVLGNRDRIVAASCAAGPAFEGGQIRHGMPGSKEAIDAVAIDSEGNVYLHTIDGIPPLGICGSGLVDAVSELRRMGMVDRNGQLSNKIERGHRNLARRMTKFEGQSAFVLSQGNEKSNSKKICITQKDIRELQLAKGALWAGIRILMRVMGIQSQEIAEIFLAGAFGNYVKPESAIRIGLMPAFEKRRIKPVGNAAGTGAKMALLSLKEREEANMIVEQIEYIELAKHPDFQNEFIQGMSFPIEKGTESQFL